MAGDANANIFVFDDREYPGEEEAETTFVEKSSTPTGTGGRVEEAGKVDDEEMYTDRGGDRWQCERGSNRAKPVFCGVKGFTDGGRVDFFVNGRMTTVTAVVRAPIARLQRHLAMGGARAELESSESEVKSESESSDEAELDVMEIVENEHVCFRRVFHQKRAHFTLEPNRSLNRIIHPVFEEG
ncbi:hypothetical protein BKA82DRAFT_4010596 [Pisolithus tinctorius]|nr:hypothetical protein BKA82DRAFT_4010596 [Pisolithus tinctorius]